MSRPSEFNQVVFGFKAHAEGVFEFSNLFLGRRCSARGLFFNLGCLLLCCFVPSPLPTVPIAAPTATEWLTSLPAISPTHYEFYSNLYKNLVFLANYRFGIMDGDSEFNNAV